jgi:hypothetical protein
MGAIEALRSWAEAIRDAVLATPRFVLATLVIAGVIGALNLLPRREWAAPDERITFDRASRGLMRAGVLAAIGLLWPAAWHAFATLFGWLMVGLNTLALFAIIAAFTVYSALHAFSAVLGRRGRRRDEHPPRDGG